MPRARTIAIVAIGLVLFAGVGYAAFYIRDLVVDRDITIRNESSHDLEVRIGPPDLPSYQRVTIPAGTTATLKVEKLWRPSVEFQPGAFGLPAFACSLDSVLAEPVVFTDDGPSCELLPLPTPPWSLVASPTAQPAN